MLSRSRGPEVAVLQSLAVFSKVVVQGSNHFANLDVGHLAHGMLCMLFILSPPPPFFLFSFSLSFFRLYYLLTF